jgi:hypothetical protein
MCVCLSLCICLCGPSKDIHVTLVQKVAMAARTDGLVPLLSLTRQLPASAGLS